LATLSRTGGDLFGGMFTKVRGHQFVVPEYTNN